MSSNQNRLAVTCEYSVTNYLPAMLKTFKSGWCIEYYVENPQTHNLDRKRVKVQRLASRYNNKNEAKKHINNIILALNMKLSTGWNPYFDSGSDTRMYTPLKEAAARYLEDIERDLRPATYRTYKTFIKVFCEWIEDNHSGLYSSMITHPMVVRFMDYVYLNRKGVGGDGISSSAYNAYIKQGSAFFNWMIERCYCKENHFQKIKSKRVEEKKRVLIPEEIREQICEYLKFKNPRYLLMLKLIYSALLRPKEIRMLRVEDISLKEKQVRVRKDVAKNGHERIVPLSDEILGELVDIGFHYGKMTDYIFGEHFETCNKMMGHSVMDKHWAKLRKALSLPEEMQMYSFRDTGISEMIKNGVDPLSVKQLADHSSLSITSVYTKHADPDLRDKILEKSPKFTKGEQR